MRYPDIKKRDGLSRTGTCEIGDEMLQFPVAVDMKDFIPGLPGQAHANIPLSADEEFVRLHRADYSGLIAAHPSTGPDNNNYPQSGIVMVPNWHTALQNSRLYVTWLQNMKEIYPPDAVWYAPAAALPSNVAVLVATGYDIFDYTAVDLMTAKGVFCTQDGEYPADKYMRSGICTCSGCSEENLHLHNREALLRELAAVRHAVSEGRIREMVEMRCRTSPRLVEIIRLLDRSTEFAEIYAPIARKAPLNAYTAESVHRPEIRRFAERVCERFVPSRTDVAVILPCSARKPYSFSRSHHLLRSAVRERAHELIFTSPMGCVPREIEAVYPAAHYDVPVTGKWDRDELEFIETVFRTYFAKHNYRRVIVHVDERASACIADALDRCNVEPEYTCKGHPASPESLSALDEAVGGEPRIAHNTLRGTISWQFGVDIDTRLLEQKGRRGNRKILKKGKTLFTIDEATGLMRPTLPGWDLLPDVYRIEIDDFSLKGDVLAPGVVNADPCIRVGDEVFIMGKQAKATGRAAMSGPEMMKASHGVAVRVRKVKRF